MNRRLYYTSNEIAKWLGLNDGTQLYALIMQEELDLPHSFIGTHMVFPALPVDAWFERKTRENAETFGPDWTPDYEATRAAYEAAEKRRTDRKGGFISRQSN
jgi:hypothetical protein